MDESLFTRLSSLLFSRPMFVSPPAWGRAHIQATAGRKVKRLRTGGKVYGMNGPRACARRRRQIAKGMLKVTTRMREVA